MFLSTQCSRSDLSSPLQNFEALQLDEIKQSIAVRRNRIFLLMEEVRRLRIQQRLKVGACLPRQPVRRNAQTSVSSSAKAQAAFAGCQLGSEPPCLLLGRSMLHVAASLPCAGH